MDHEVAMAKQDWIKGWEATNTLTGGYIAFKGRSVSTFSFTEKEMQG